MNEGDGGDISTQDVATPAQQVCLYFKCQAPYKGKKDSKFCSKPCFYEHQKTTNKQPATLASCLSQVAGSTGGSQEIFSTPNARSKSKRPLSGDE
jgi:hypothetical protein